MTSLRLQTISDVIRVLMNFPVNFKSRLHYLLRTAMALKPVQNAERTNNRTFQGRKIFFCTSLKGLLSIAWGLNIWLSGEAAAVAQGYCRAEVAERGGCDRIPPRANPSPFGPTLRDPSCQGN